MIWFSLVQGCFREFMSKKCVSKVTNVYRYNCKLKKMHLCVIVSIINYIFLNIGDLQ